ncbi:hypothetical protein I4U23_005156 [Adineta vaga]|nr:hypothetical protein I4U23_005156 [Adineta vaga]
MFVSDDWIKYLFSPNIGSLYQGDFRASASSYFQLLAAFCLHANRSIHDTLTDFHQETLLTPNVLLQDSFNTTVQARSEFLKLSIANSVSQLLQLIGSMTNANELQTAIQTSKILLKKGTVASLEHVWFRSVEPPNCFCGALTSCSRTSAFFNVGDHEIKQDAP